MDRSLRPLTIVNVPILPTDTELVAVSVQGLVADGGERAVDSTLQQAKVGLGGVRVNVALHLVAVGVLDDEVAALAVLLRSVLGGDIVRHEANSDSTLRRISPCIRPPSGE